MQKQLEIRKGRQEQWKPTSTREKKILLLDFPYEYIFRMNPYYFFLSPITIPRIMNAKKKLEIREGRQDQWKTTSTPWIFFFFHYIFPMNIQKGYLLFFFMPC